MSDEADVLDLDNVVDTPEIDDTDPPEDDIVLDGEEFEDDPTIKKVRDAARDANRRAADAERRAAELEAERDKPIEAGEEPTLESCEYDEDKFRTSYREWTNRSEAAKRRQSSVEEAERTRQKSIQGLEVAYRTSVTRLAPANQAIFDEADKSVRAALGDDAPIAIAGYFKEPAKLIVALHKYPARMQAIVDEPDNMKKLLLLKEVEMAIKSSGTRKPPPEPDAPTIQRGSAPLSKPKPDAVAEKLLSDAANGGSMDAYHKHMKAKKAAARPAA